MVTTETCPEIYLSPADISRTLGNHPSAAVRWMRRGAVLSNGDRLFLRFVRLPGGYRVKPEWLDAFLAALTEDRSAKADDAPTAADKSPRVQQLKAALSQAGF
jgi:hypothetical protein